MAERISTTDAGWPARQPAQLDSLAARVAVVVSAYNAPLTARLLEGARWEFARRGGGVEGLAVFRAPGAFELPALAAEAARTGRYDAVVALGAIIRGQTEHDRVIAGAVASALAQAGVESGVPIAFGVLTCETWAQAEARSAPIEALEAHARETAEQVEDDHQPGKPSVSNKGVEAMAAALEAARAMREIHRWGGVDAPAGRAHRQ